MPPTPTEFNVLQQFVAERIRGYAELSTVSTITENRHDIENEIKRQLAVLGLSIIVGTAGANVTRPNLPGPVFDQITFDVDVLENVTINRGPKGTGVDCLTTAWHVCRAVHRSTVRTPPYGASTIVCDNPTLAYQPRADGILQYRIRFKVTS